LPLRRFYPVLPLRNLQLLAETDPLNVPAIPAANASHQYGTNKGIRKYSVKKIDREMEDSPSRL
jgi:hypothetical protein